MCAVMNIAAFICCGPPAPGRRFQGGPRPWAEQIGGRESWQWSVAAILDAGLEHGQIGLIGSPEVASVARDAGLVGMIPPVGTTNEEIRRASMVDWLCEGGIDGMEGKLGAALDLALIVPPVCPFLSAAAIHRALAQWPAGRHSGPDAVFAARPLAHRVWEEGDVLEPGWELIESKAGPKGPGRLYVESGGLYVVGIDMLRSSGRFAGWREARGIPVSWLEGLRTDDPEELAAIKLAWPAAVTKGRANGKGGRP